ncbi:MAG: hypothetical protein ACOC1K_03230, partial [Nanoarchaeota archaeon]
YPTFLKIVTLYGVFRFAKGILKRLSGNDNGVSDALGDIIVAFFWMHISLPLVIGIYNFMEGLSRSLEPVIRTIGGG